VSDTVPVSDTSSGSGGEAKLDELPQLREATMAKKRLTPDEKRKMTEILKGIRAEVHALRVRLEQRGG
jgi:hypothetical protein